MKFGFYFLSLLSFLVLSVGCSPLYNEIPHMPKKIEMKQNANIHKVQVWIMEGGRAPMKVKNLKAQCADQTICTVTIDNSKKHESFIVINKLKAGQTTVNVEYFHPVRKKTFKPTINIMIP